MATNFREVIRALVDSGAEFIIIGGVAARAHGSARFTEDLDVVYRRSKENIDRIIQALKPYQPYLRGAPPNLPFEFDARTIQHGLNFTFTTSLGPLDLLGEVTGGGTYEDLLSHCVTYDFFGEDCLCLDLPTLIRVKRAAGRPKDFEAIAELEALVEEKTTGNDPTTSN
ncbi:MAG TPA: nucleotidyl transferase AbiEii/AbiGii toxin family protein [Pyrinomonadaceae bacterium]